MNANSKKNQEIQTIQSYFNEFEQPNLSKIKKAEVFKKIFEYLFASQYLLEMEKFRSAIKDRIAYIMLDEQNKDIIPIVEESVNKLCQRLQWYEGENAPIIKGCPLPKGMLPNRPYEILGAGTFGVVFEPALPNMVEGDLIEFPGNVTKAFYKRSAFEGAKNAASSIAHLMGENTGHRFHTYRKQYTAKNLPSSLYTKLKKINKTLKPSDALHLMRLPNLGIDLKTLIPTKKYRELRSIPVRTILEQINKLLKQTASLAKNKYVHTDIRETNIMVNPATGILTIVDFDWLRPFIYIYENYPFGYYNNPPEFLLLKYWPIILRQKTITIDFLEDLLDEDDLQNYAKPMISAFQINYNELGITNEELLKDVIVKADVVNAEALIDIVNNKGNIGALQEFFLKRAMPTFDNFGLGLSLLEMLAFVYPGSTTINQKRSQEMRLSFLNYLSTILKNGYTQEELVATAEALYATTDLLRAMSSFYLYERPTPSEASEKMDTILKSYVQKLPAIEKNALGELGRLELLASTRKNRSYKNNRRYRKTRKN